MGGDVANELFVFFRRPKASLNLLLVAAGMVTHELFFLFLLFASSSCGKKEAEASLLPNSFKQCPCPTSEPDGSYSPLITFYLTLKRLGIDPLCFCLSLSLRRLLYYVTNFKQPCLKAQALLRKSYSLSLFLDY